MDNNKKSLVGRMATVASIASMALSIIEEIGKTTKKE